MRSPVTRRAFAAAGLILAALVSAGCQQADHGETNVLVIGEAPKIADPAAGPLSEAQAVLLSNTGQGLVRFDASGEIVPGLAERWNVTDDGLSYIFRLQSIEWPDGRKLTAQQVARLLKRQIASRSDNPLKDTLGAIDQIVPMTDRVLEISLKASRPHLLQLLAQPEFSIVREGQGTGPFLIAAASKPNALKLERTVEDLDEELSSVKKWSWADRRRGRRSLLFCRRRPISFSEGLMRTFPSRVSSKCRETRFASTLRWGYSGSFPLGQTGLERISSCGAC